MTHGPGKYDPECTRIMTAEDADVVMVVVIGGKKKGTGFAMQRKDYVNQLTVAEALREVARQIGEDAS